MLRCTKFRELGSICNHLIFIDIMSVSLFQKLSPVPPRRNKNVKMYEIYIKTFSFTFLPNINEYRLL